MEPTHVWIDEVDLDKFFQKEPTPAEVMARFGYWEPSANDKMVGIEHHSWQKLEQDRLRRELKNRRTKEQQNCLHGRRPFPINWREGTHPLGERQFWANIEGVPGGPYLLNEADHQILHNVGRKHEHVQTSTVRDDRIREVAKMFTP